LPETLQEDARDLLFQPGQADVQRYSARSTASMSTAEILQQLARSRPGAIAPARMSDRLVGQQSDELSANVFNEEERDDEQPKIAQAIPARAVSSGRENFDAVLTELLSDSDAVFRSVSVLYQDFLVRCRKHGLNGRLLDLTAFRRKLAGARAGAASMGLEEGELGEARESEWQKAMDMAADLAEDVHGVFLLLARAAFETRTCPSDLLIARALGSRSPRRARSMVSYMEQRGLIVCQEEMDGSRVIIVPDLGWQTAPGDPSALDDVSDEQRRGIA
jgi:hypothetical protein